jgi:hypothetical protein
MSSLTLRVTSLELISTSGRQYRTIRKLADALEVPYRELLKRE